MNDNKKMTLFIKKHIEKILMALGVILLTLFAVYTQKSNIPTQNTWAAFIGFVLFYAPFLTGLWIVSEKIKEKRKTLGMILKGFIIFASLSVLGGFIAFLFTL